MTVSYSQFKNGSVIAILRHKDIKVKAHLNNISELQPWVDQQLSKGK